ncbi:hypothetical protein [Vibrio rotiferianus]|uniref:hypothetical protein n=1 Tax=Vibrio rotiferianus TaxID=190895 RepID=UPI00148CA773|nr:hypothetical protein [Vibrio rotiferianus]NOH67813.1 hypothetical protein [Vibrio rotiferianus]
MKKIILASVVSTILVGCGGSDGGSSALTPPTDDNQWEVGGSFLNTGYSYKTENGVHAVFTGNGQQHSYLLYKGEVNGGVNLVTWYGHIAKNESTGVDTYYSLDSSGVVQPMDNVEWYYKGDKVKVVIGSDEFIFTQTSENDVSKPQTYHSGLFKLHTEYGAGEYKNNYSENGFDLKEYDFNEYGLGTSLYNPSSQCNFSYGLTVQYGDSADIRVQGKDHCQDTLFDEKGGSASLFDGEVLIAATLRQDYNEGVIASFSWFNTGVGFNKSSKEVVVKYRTVGY